MLVAEPHDGLEYPWFAALASNGGFEPPAGELFRPHSGAIRRNR